MNEILFIINSAFTRGGFTVETEVSGVRLHKSSTIRYAVPKLKKIEVSKCAAGRGQYLGAETTVTAAVKCYGTECGFRDGPTLRGMVEAVGRILLLEHEKNVRMTEIGELITDAVTGRLFITVTVVLKGYEDAEVVAA